MTSNANRAPAARPGGNVAPAEGTYEESESLCVLGEGNVDPLLARLYEVHGRRPVLREAASEVTASGPFHRAAIHEAGHAVAAAHFRLPLREVFICHDGTGATRYTRHLTRSEAAPWVVATLAGPQAEIFQFGNAPEGGDLYVIQTMVDRVGLSWNGSILAKYHSDARRLVIDNWQPIAIVADELLRARQLSGRELAALVSSAASAGPRPPPCLSRGRW